MTNTITLKLTFEELEQIDKYIELNEDTRQLFDKIRSAYPKSPVETAYKRVYGEYPPTTPSVSNYEDNRWSAFQSGYSCGYGDGLENSNDFAIPKKIVDKPEEKQPTIIFENRGKFDVVSYHNPQNSGDEIYWRIEQPNSFSWWRRYIVPHRLDMVQNKEKEQELEQLYHKQLERERIKRNLKTSLQELSNGDVRPIDDVVKEAKKEQESWMNKPINELVETLNKNPPDCLKFQMGKTLEQLIERWWCEYPGTENWTSDATRWQGFQAGYNAAYEEKVAQEPEELKTLYQMLDDKKHHPDTCVFICDIVKNWMSQYTHNVMTGEYLKGYEECLTVLEENLK